MGSDFNQPSPRGLWKMTSGLFQCQYCGGYNGYRSRSKTFAEKFILPLLFLRTVRCGDCHKRSVQTFLVQVRERRESKSARSATAGA
jgi:hypothetical protein